MSTSRISTELDRLIELQRAKCLALARRLKPGLTEDDLTQPHDFPELLGSWHWNYEDGILAGLLSARALVLRMRSEDSEDLP